MRNRWNTHLAGTALCVACAISSQPASADATAPAAFTGNRGGDAQVHSDQADKLVQEGKYKEACPLYDLAQKEDPSPITLFDLGDCYEHIGQVTSAWKRFVESANSAKDAARKATDPDRKSAAEEHARKSTARADALAPRRPMLKVVVEGSAKLLDLSVKIDGRLMESSEWGQPSPIDPGEHRITAEAPGKSTWSLSIRIALAKVGESPEVREVKIPELAALPVPKQRVAALFVGGATLGAVVVGSIFGAQAFSKWDEARRTCSGNNTPMLPNECTSNEGERYDTAKSISATGQVFAHISTASFVLAGVGLATTGFLWFTASPSVPSVPSIEVAPAAGPTGASLTMRAHF
jgi:hypothetical protein